MINLAEEIYKHLSLVTGNVYFSILPEGVVAKATHIVYDLYESGSYNLMHTNNYANDVQLTVKILNPDALTLLRLGESVKDQLLSNPYEYNRDIKYNNSIPIFPDAELETLQLTLLFSVYYDSTVTPYTAPVVVERGKTTSLSSGAVYEVIHIPVSITDRHGNIVLKDDGESYAEAPVTPVTITDRFGTTVTKGEGESYSEAPVTPASVIENGVTAELGEGESYTVVHTPARVINLNDNTETLLKDGEELTIPLIQEQLEMVLNFPADADDSISLTVNDTATYSGEASVNVSSVTYNLNSVPVTLPVTLAAGDTLTVAITRTVTALAAKITLKNY